jgi:parvulin-like peptidyl-prolyl isomerase
VVLGLEPNTWAGPIASPYGLHLVWVDEHQPERLLPLDAIREPIALVLVKQRAAENLQHGLERLRSLYEIRVEAAPAGVAAGATQDVEAAS